MGGVVGGGGGGGGGDGEGRGGGGVVGGGGGRTADLGGWGAAALRKGPRVAWEGCGDGDGASGLGCLGCEGRRRPPQRYGGQGRVWAGRRGVGARGAGGGRWWGEPGRAGGGGTGPNGWGRAGGGGGDTRRTLGTRGGAGGGDGTHEDRRTTRPRARTRKTGGGRETDTRHRGEWENEREGWRTGPTSAEGSRESKIVICDGLESPLPRTCLHEAGSRPLDKREGQAQ